MVCHLLFVLIMCTLETNVCNLWVIRWILQHVLNSLLMCMCVWVCVKCKEIRDWFVRCIFKTMFEIQVDDLIWNRANDNYSDLYIYCISNLLLFAFKVCLLMALCVIILLCWRFQQQMTWKQLTDLIWLNWRDSVPFINLEFHSKMRLHCVCTWSYSILIKW